jgi:hypothetical protein
MHNHDQTTTNDQTAAEVLREIYAAEQRRRAERNGNIQWAILIAVIVAVGALVGWQIYKGAEAERNQFGSGAPAVVEFEVVS